MFEGSNFWCQVFKGIKLCVVQTQQRGIRRHHSGPGTTRLRVTDGCLTRIEHWEGLAGGRHVLRPRWQFSSEGGGAVEHLPKLLAALGHVPQQVVWRG
jgi:hypothetical protein